MRIGCVDDIVRAVNDSGSPNVALLVGTQNGEVIVPMFNWSEYFEEVTVKTALKGISHMHHFHFTSTASGKIFVKDTVDDNEQCINLLKSSWHPSSCDLLTHIIPPGLSLERQYYLYDKIRQFVPHDLQDLVCAQPAQPRP